MPESMTLRVSRSTIILCGCVVASLFVGACGSAARNNPSKDPADKLDEPESWAAVRLSQEPFGNSLSEGYVSADGKSALWFGADFTLLHDEDEFSRLPAAPTKVVSVDGSLKLVVVGEGGFPSELRRLPTWELVEEFPHEMWGHPILFDGGVVVVSEDQIHVELGSGESVSIPHASDLPLAVEISMNGQTLVKSTGRHVEIFSVFPTPQLLMDVTCVDDKPTSLAVDDTGTWVAISEFGILYRLINVKTGERGWAAFARPGFELGVSELLVLDEHVAQDVLAQARRWLEQQPEDEPPILVGDTEIIAPELPAFPSSADEGGWQWPRRLLRDSSPMEHQLGFVAQGPVSFQYADFAEAPMVDLIAQDELDEWVVARWDLSRGIPISVRTMKQKNAWLQDIRNPVLQEVSQTEYVVDVLPSQEKWATEHWGLLFIHDEHTHRLPDGHWSTELGAFGLCGSSGWRSPIFASTGDWFVACSRHQRQMQIESRNFDGTLKWTSSPDPFASLDPEERDDWESLDDWGIHLHDKGVVALSVLSTPTIWLLSNDDGRVLAQRQLDVDTSKGGADAWLELDGGLDEVLVVARASEGHPSEILRVRLPELTIIERVELSKSPASVARIPDSRGALVAYVDGTARVVPFQSP